MTIEQAYQQFTSQIQTIYEVREANSIARIVFEDEFGIYGFNSKNLFPENQTERYFEIIERLQKHEPVQYILGEADFYGHKFKVNPSVLIPRQETEELVYWIKNTIEKEIYGSDTVLGKKGILEVLDIGTGSGCIPITLKKLLPELKVSAIDISTLALNTAKENAGTLLNQEINFTQFDILDQQLWHKQGNFDIIVSNPPYIPNKEKKLMPERVLNNEPGLALFVPDDDPILFYKKIAFFSMNHLVNDGYLFYEINEYNSKDVLNFLKEINFGTVVLENDINGKPRMIRAQKRTRRQYFVVNKGV